MQKNKLVGLRFWKVCPICGSKIKTKSKPEFRVCPKCKNKSKGGLK